MIEKDFKKHRDDIVTFWQTQGRWTLIEVQRHGQDFSEFWIRPSDSDFAIPFEWASKDRGYQDLFWAAESLRESLRAWVDDRLYGDA